MQVDQHTFVGKIPGGRLVEEQHLDILKGDRRHSRSWRDLIQPVSVADGFLPLRDLLAQDTQMGLRSGVHGVAARSLELPRGVSCELAGHRVRRPGPLTNA
jgi:hypothetical protein